MFPHSPRHPVPAALSATVLVLCFTPPPLVLAQSSGRDVVQTTVATIPQAALMGRTVPPDTNSCPWKYTPIAPVDTSEVPQPGHTVPPPLPVPNPPAGGPQMGNCGVIAAPDFVVPSEQTAAAWIVFDLDTGDIIAAKDPHGRYRPASIIKVLLALVALDQLKLDRVVEVSQESANMEGSRVGIVGGVRYTVRQLLQGLLMASGNDAAHAIAQVLGGDTRTLQLVNAQAKELSMSDTRVASYSGLDAPGMSTSAFDMALAYRAAWKNHNFATLVKTKHVILPGRPDGDPLEVWNDNHLLQNAPDAIGGKTGFTDDARHTFVGAMDKSGRRLAAVILDTTVDKGRPWQQAQHFLEAGYASQHGSKVGTLTPQLDPTTHDGDTDTHSSHLSKQAQPKPAPPESNLNDKYLIVIASSIGTLLLFLIMLVIRPKRRHR